MRLHRITFKYKWGWYDAIREARRECHARGATFNNMAQRVYVIGWPE